MFIFLKEQSEGFPWKIDRSVICTQLSRFNMRCSFATAASFRKSFGDIDVPFKLIIFFSAKNQRGTFWYKFPISAKSIPSHSSNILAVDLHPWNTYLHHVRLTVDTCTRLSGPRNWNTSGQKNRSTNVIAEDGSLPEILYCPCRNRWSRWLIVFCAKLTPLDWTILCEVSGRLFIICCTIPLSLWCSLTANLQKSACFECIKWSQGKLLKSTFTSFFSMHFIIVVTLSRSLSSIHFRKRASEPGTIEASISKHAEPDSCLIMFA